MPKNHLIIDEGNTQCKAAIIEDGQIVARCTITDTFDAQLVEFIAGKIIAKIITSSTRQSVVKLPAMLDGVPHIAMSANLKLPIKLNYETPQTLGTDRIAAAVGANYLYPNQNTLIIDIGTAITIDFLNADGVFQGGIISPGPEMRAKALNHFTGKLPLVSITETANLQGKNTIEALQFGIINGINFEILGYIKKYHEIVNNLNVIVTGGASHLFNTEEFNAKLEPDLVLLGMNYLLEKNI